MKLQRKCGIYFKLKIKFTIELTKKYSRAFHFQLVFALDKKH